MLPEQFLNRMEMMLKEEYPDFLASLEKDAYKALRVNLRKTDVQKFLKQSPFQLNRVPWTVNGFYYNSEDQPGKHPFHEAGVYYIQEPSAMAPVPFLGIEKGDRILDLCAAPGGKTSQIADELDGTGILVTNEIHPQRARILSENVERMGIKNAIVTNETPKKLAQVFPGYFDKILVDAPCSGEGMFRKNEEACEEWSPENVSLCAERQDEILKEAQAMLRPGGRLVYSTCTFAPLEDEGTVSRFLKNYPEFQIETVEKPEGFTNGVAKWVEQAADGIDATMRLMPHKVKGEGHYLAVLKKSGEDTAVYKRECANGTEKSIPPKEYGEFLEFSRQFLTDADWNTGTFIRFGDQLYFGPADMPALKGLKVLRPGLHLGTLKKNRFEPSHALALSLKPGEVKTALHYSMTDGEPLRFMGGQTLILKDEELANGWCLVCVEGYSLGWGKAAGSIVKNHYPKGLRKFS